MVFSLPTYFPKYIYAQFWNEWEHQVQRIMSVFLGKNQTTQEDGSGL